MPIPFKRNFRTKDSPAPPGGELLIINISAFRSGDESNILWQYHKNQEEVAEDLTDHPEEEVSDPEAVAPEVDLRNQAVAADSTEAVSYHAKKLNIESIILSVFPR